MAPSHAAMIEHYMDLNRYEKALELIYEELAEQPENGYLHFQSATAHYRLKQYRQAEEHLHSAFQCGYSPVNVHYLLGHIHSEQEQWAGSEQEYLSALRESPNNGRALAAYGALLMKVGEWKRGMEAMEEAERLSPNDPEVLRHRLYYDIARNHNNSRMMHLEKYMARADDQTYALLQLGINEYYKGNYKLAKEHFREAYARNPTDKSLLHNVRLLEYQANPLLFPITLSDKIGGMPFLWFWLSLLLLVILPFQEALFIWGVIAALLLIAYLYMARMLVQLHQDALDSNEAYWLACIKSPIFIAVFGNIAAVAALLYFRTPDIPVAVIIGSRLVSHFISKKRSSG